MRKFWTQVAGVTLWPFYAMATVVIWIARWRDWRAMGKIARRRDQRAMRKLSREQLEIIREVYCNGCKGGRWFWESACYEDCKGFWIACANFGKE